MSSGQIQVLSVILSALAIVFIPLLTALIRGIRKWTTVELRLAELADDMRALVTDKDRTHQAMIQSMADDRKANDRRLRWLEEHYWKGRE